MGNYKLISVESRKGGVGKTTMALNIAKVFVDKEYDVLILDCDITGTPITQAASHSIYWSSYVKTAYTIEKSPVNLMCFFEMYLKGSDTAKRLIESLQYEKSKIHLIGSEVYDRNGNLIIDPRNLMNDLYSFWFVDMIIKIAVEFEKIGDNTNKVIILDNSPGYVGIGKALRDRLTNMGPDFARFLFVSSLDEQDIESTIRSSLDIQKTMETKWELANLHHKIVSNDNPKEACDNVDGILGKYSSLKSFYEQLIDSNAYESDILNKPQVKSYISVIVNKVPAFYKNEGGGYRFPDYQSEERKTIINDIFPLDDNGYPKYRVEYDSSISSQFIDSSILPKEDNKTSVGKGKLDDSFKKFTNRIEHYAEGTDMLKKASGLNASYKKFLDSLSEAGYQWLSKSLDDSYITNNYIKELIATIRRLGNVVLPATDSLEFDKKIMMAADRRLLGNLIVDKNLGDCSAILYSVFDCIYGKAGFKNKRSNKYLAYNLSILFKTFLKICNNDYDPSKSDFKTYLVNQIKKKELKQIIKVKVGLQMPIISRDDGIKVDQHVMAMYNNYLPLFYNQICYAIIRLIDCAQDYSIVRDACRATISKGTRMLTPDLRNYLYAVIIEKSKPHKQETLKDLLDKPFEMQAVQQLLSELIER